MTCEFSNPVNYLGEVATSGEAWNFKTSICDELELFELIENASTGAEFYISKTVSYGDVLLIIFVSVILVFGLFKFIWNFVTVSRNKI